MIVENEIRIGNQSIQAYKQKEMFGKKEQEYSKSLITSIYRAWEHHRVPAIHYHYLLSILASKPKEQQIAFMRKELHLLNQKRDHYHIISSYLQTREESLREIKLHIHALRSNDDWPSVGLAEENFNSSYQVVYRSEEQEAQKPTNLEALMVHLTNYQRATYEVIVSIRRWQQELFDLGYQGLVQFIYQHQDYLQKLQNDTVSIQEEYSQFFEQNLFLIFRKEHELTDYGLVYQQLKLQPHFVGKIKEALEIVANHESDCERHRLLGVYKQQSVKRTIRKTQSLKGLYSRYRKDSLIVRDSSLFGDRPKFLYNKNILSRKNIIINPQINLYPMDRKSSEPTTEKLEEIKKGFLSSVLDRQSLSEELKRKSYFGSKRGVGLKQLKDLKGPNKSNISTSIENPLKKIQKSLDNKQTLEFKIDKDIPQKDIIPYLEGIFQNKKSSSQIQNIAKMILKEKATLTLIRVQVGHLLVAWLGVTFIGKGVGLRKSVNIQFLFKLMVFPSLQTKLTEEFKKIGYGVVLMEGQVVSDQKIVTSEDRLVHVSYKIGEEGQNVLKKLMKDNRELKNSRVLKYYTYSKESKYHEVCQHRKNQCRLSFWVEELRKISIEGTQYLRARCDRISKRGNSWKVQHHLNSLVMIVGSTFDEVLDSSKLTDIDFDSSSGEEKEETRQFICLPLVKTMHRYVNQDNRSILVQYLKTNPNCAQEISIRQSQKDLKDTLIIERPFVLAFAMVDEEGISKTIALLEFN